jgi:uncharacterized protein (DUF2062 family)
MEGKLFGIVPKGFMVAVIMMWMLIITIMVFQIYKRNRLEKEFLNQD